MTAAFASAPLARVDQGDYFDVLHAAIAQSRRRVWANIFLFDPRPDFDRAGRCADLVALLGHRRQAGVDVRVLLTGAVRTPELGVANMAAGFLLQGHGVPVRRVFTAPEGRVGSHAKAVVIDDEAYVGSQNWTEDAFARNLEDCVMIGQPAVEHVGETFMELWRVGRGLPRHAH